MKFIVSKTEMLNAVGTVIRAVPAHTTMDILKCILIEARHNSLVLTANDMDMGIETRMAATIEEGGLIAVDARMFSEIVRKLPDEIMNFESDSNYNILITCGKARFTIGGMPGEEFPALPVIDEEISLNLSQFTLKSVIQDTIFSIATNENNKIMTGELFELSGDILKVVALDGHRIAMRRVSLKENYDKKRVIVPGKTLQDISRIISGEIEDMVTISIAKNHIVFNIPETRLVSRLIDGEYFNVDQMISSDYETKLTVSRGMLMGSVDRATLFVKEGDKKPIILEIEDNELRLSIQSPLGSMTDELEIEKEGRDLAIGFNPRFMMDALKAIRDENISIYMVNPKAPCFIRDEDMTYTYLILPVNFIR